MLGIKSAALKEEFSALFSIGLPTEMPAMHCFGVMLRNAAKASALSKRRISPSNAGVKSGKRTQALPIQIRRVGGWFSNAAADFNATPAHSIELSAT